MNKKTVRDIDVKGKKVLVRCDFNVPIDESGRITDDTRITAAIPTIKYLMENGARVILCSHLGRPKGEVNKKYSLSPVAKKLTDLLEANVKFANDVTGDSAKNNVESLADGEVALLENVRFDSREEKNDDTLAMELADLSDGIYVNDAFGTAHRAHSSTEGVSHHVKESVAGLLMEEEIKALGGVLENPSKPFVAILGGAKVSDKIEVIENLLDKVDELLIGGGMAFTFLKASGYDIGDSICENDKLDTAKAIMERAVEKNVKITFPKDINVAKKEVLEDGKVKFLNSKYVDIDKIPDGYQGVDIGPKTILNFGDKIKNAKTILWNGPLGICEFDEYSIGTEEVAETIAQNKEVTSVVGGGDSVAAIKKLGLEDEFTHLSTGGGASLEFLEGKALPGIVCLSENKEIVCQKENKIVVKKQKEENEK